MGAELKRKKLRSPVMTEMQVADLQNFSLKPLRRWLNDRGC